MYGINKCKRNLELIVENCLTLRFFQKGNVHVDKLIHQCLGRI